jgi:GxxExxY protein
MFDQPSFHEVDHIVTGLAFGIHNEFGRYLEERLYQRELARRCLEAGLRVNDGFLMTAAIDEFRKSYRCDLLINEGVIIEVKAVNALGPVHQGQTLNYLFLSGLRHASMLNFRTQRVQHEFVSTTIRWEDRQEFRLVTDQFKPLTRRCELMLDSLQRCLREWGTRLDPLLYRDAITYFLGGEQEVLREVTVHSEAALIGTQQVHLVAEEIGFSVTTSTHNPQTVFDHHLRFIRHTPLRAIQWINLDHDRIAVQTIEK